MSENEIKLNVKIPENVKVEDDFLKTFLSIANKEFIVQNILTKVVKPDSDPETVGEEFSKYMNMIVKNFITYFRKIKNKDEIEIKTKDLYIHEAWFASVNIDLEQDNGGIVIPAVAVMDNNYSAGGKAMMVIILNRFNHYLNITGYADELYDEYGGDKKVISEVIQDDLTELSTRVINDTDKDQINKIFDSYFTSKVKEIKNRKQS